MPGLHHLAQAQEKFPSGAVSITDEERQRTRRTCSFPADRKPRQDPRFYPRKPTINVGRWFGDWEAKLSGLELAAGMVTSRGGK